MIQGFEFEHEGKKFTCTVESQRPSSTDVWWWFRVSSDANHRYAPFQVARTDTRASVRDRIVRYYEELLRRRAEPAPSHWRRGAPDKTAAATAPAAVQAASAAAPAASAASK